MVLFHPFQNDILYMFIFNIYCMNKDKKDPLYHVKYDRNRFLENFFGVDNVKKDSIFPYAYKDVQISHQKGLSLLSRTL